ncbi:MAG TPA: hypothetical protein VGK44_02750 [Casimicrobiaceae bacterium]|jgi:hypothetical protein
MNTFKKTTLYTALAGIGALGMAGTANAVHVNPDGLGQVLIYPYYTTQTSGVAQPFNSLLSVVNSTASAKAVKVRFLEGKNSREVLDFNLYLSPRDVWVAGVVPAGVTANSGAGIYTPDKSCTTPVVSADATNPTLFVNYAYAGDSGGDGLDRTREGYVEIIEMGNVTGTTAAAVLHDPATGNVPCTAAGLTDSVAQANTVLGNGGLFGGITLINVLSGEDVTADAVALEAFRTTGSPIWFAPGVTLPDLTLANPPQTEIFNGSTATTYGFATGIDAVSAALMHNTLMNEYVLDTATKSGTDWVVTFPTKRFYVSSGAALPPFQRPFSGGTSCDDILVTTWDREERTVVVQTGFSPPPPQGGGTALCYEANVVTFKGSNVLGSANVVDIVASNLPSGAQNGWALFDLTQSVGGTAVPAHRLASLNPVATFHGLPVIGFMVETFNNGNIPSGSAIVQSAYGGNFVHKTTRLIN